MLQQPCIEKHPAGKTQVDVVNEVVTGQTKCFGDIGTEQTGIIINGSIKQDKCAAIPMCFRWPLN